MAIPCLALPVVMYVPHEASLGRSRGTSHVLLQSPICNFSVQSIQKFIIVKHLYERLCILACCFPLSLSTPRIALPAMRVFTLPFLLLCVLFDLGQATFSSPKVTIKNGTVQGLFSPQWNQDLFLGVPYAQPPLGDLRFRWPRSIDTPWNQTLDATNYGYSCYQYGTTFNLSEDCLTLNGLYVTPRCYTCQLNSASHSSSRI